MSAIYVYPELEIIFIHIPKCAGTTIRKYLSFITQKEEQYHAHIPTQYQAYWKFTVCRNPFDRFISSWRYCIERGWVHNLSPLQFLDHIETLETNGCPVVEEDHKFWRQTIGYMCLHHAAPMSHPSRFTEDIDYVGKFELLDNVIKDFRDWYGIKEKGVHENQSQHERFQTYYDSLLYHRVMEYYADDFDMFHYPRQMPLT